MSDDEAEFREPLNHTLSVEEGGLLRPPTPLGEKILQAANKYAGIVACVSAIVMAVCSMAGVAMIADMRANLTSESIAASGLMQLTGAVPPSTSSPKKSGTASMATGFGSMGFMFGNPEESPAGKLADMLQADLSPMFSHLADAWTRDAEVFSEVASKIGNGAPKPSFASMQTPADLAVMMMGPMMQTVGTALKTASSAFKMMSSIDPPPEAHKTSAAHLAQHATMIHRFFGVNAIEDSDGHISFPLAQYFQNMFDPEGYRSLAAACVDLTDRLHPDEFTMTTYQMSQFLGEFQQPESIIDMLMENFGGDEDESTTAWGEVEEIGKEVTGFGKEAGSKADCQKVEGNLPMCMCTQDTSFAEYVTMVKSIREVCKLVGDAFEASMTR